MAELAEGVKPGALLAALAAAPVEIRRFEVYEPSLHQIFVKRVGVAVAEGTSEERADVA
jgi:ABC-2 type transport system ATP-binding protein